MIAKVLLSLNLLILGGCAQIDGYYWIKPLACEGCQFPAPTTGVKVQSITVNSQGYQIITPSYRK